MNIATPGAAFQTSLMKIRRLQLDAVKVPARPDSINSPEFDKPLHMLAYGGKTEWSLQFDEIPKWIIRVTLDNGVVGLGESYRGLPGDTMKSFAETLIGLDLGKVNLQALPLPYGRLYDGFECALVDAFAKTHDISVSDLLGGRYRDKVYCSYWTGHRTVADAARKAKEGQDLGYDCIKFKCSSDDPVAEWCAAVKDACGSDFQIILDPNQRFEDVPTALRMAQGLAEVGNVRCLEDPIARWDVESLAHLRKRMAIPVALHVSLPYNEMGYQHITDIVRAVKLDACDYFNFNGGIYNVKRMATVAELTRKPFWHGSEVDLGILEASYLHKSAACKEALLPADIFGRVIREHDLLETPIAFANSHAAVPSGPGLGVTLDLEALSHYCQESWQTEGA